MAESMPGVSHLPLMSATETETNKEIGITLNAIQCDLRHRNKDGLTVPVCGGTGWKRGRGGGARWLWHCIWWSASTHSALVLYTTEIDSHQTVTVQRTHHVRNKVSVVKEDCRHKVMPLSYFLSHLTSCTHRSSELSQHTSAVRCAATAHTSTFRYLRYPLPGCWEGRVHGQMSEAAGPIVLVGSISVAGQKTADGRGCRSGLAAGRKSSLFLGRRWLERERAERQNKEIKICITMNMRCIRTFGI